jgi:hypothetical protein
MNWHRDQGMVAAQVMCADAGFNADQARRYIGERYSTWPRPLLPQHDGAARIEAHDLERVFADIDHAGKWRAHCFWRPRQLIPLLARQEQGRTIPLSDIAIRRQREQ